MTDKMAELFNAVGPAASRIAAADRQSLGDPISDVVNGLGRLAGQAKSDFIDAAVNRGNSDATAMAQGRPWGYANPQASAAGQHIAEHNRLGFQIRGGWSGHPVAPDDRSAQIAQIHRSLYNTTEGNS